MEKWYLISQIDKNGEETGVKKLIQGAREAATFIKPKAPRIQQRGVENVLGNMKFDEFKTFFVPPFNYEVDCLSSDEARKIDVDDEDVIKYKEIPVYECFGSDNVTFHAFGDADLLEQLTAPGLFGIEDVKEIMDELYSSGKAELVREDPEYYSMAVTKMTADEVAKLADKDSEFALKLEAAKKMLVESSAKKEDGACIEECDDGFKLAVYKEGKEVRSFKPCSTREEAEKKMEFLEEVGKLHESAEDEIGLVEIVFSPGVATKAGEAIDDSPYLKHNTSFLTSNVLALTADDEDDLEELLGEIKGQLESFGISEDEYEVNR